MSGLRVVVLDYGSGNLRSAERALAQTGADVVVTSDATAARNSDALVVPGVGAFAACMQGIRAVGGDDIVRERVTAGRPVLGICVGMQVLYDVGDEHGVETAGIGVLPGRVRKLDAPILPHMGWNTVTPQRDSSLFDGVEQERFYFVHSYGVTPNGEPVTVSPTEGSVTIAQHGEPFVAAVEREALAATQFHPEKSGAAGLRLLHNWIASLS